LGKNGVTRVTDLHLLSQIGLFTTNDLNRKAVTLLPLRWVGAVSIEMNVAA